MPTASVHSYKNLLLGSSSIYKFEGKGKVQDYNLPEYPKRIDNRLQISRLIGNFEDYEKLNLKMMKINSNLNVRDKKQVNFILVKFDNVTSDHLYALRDYWKNGKKNDYIIALNMNGDYVQDMLIISWTEAEILNTKITTMTLHKRHDMKNFDKYLENVEYLIKENFIRKEMKDYEEYIVIETSLTSKIICFVLEILIIIGFIICPVKKMMDNY